MVERNTRIKYNQIASVRPNDMDATNELVDTYVPAYDAATGKFTWVTADTAAIKNLIDYADSPMIVTGGDITEGTTGTFTVAALTALLRITDSLTGELEYVTLIEQANQSIAAADTTYFICLDYNGGTPQIVLSITNPYSRISSPDRTQIVIGKVMKDASDNVHYISGGYNFQDGVRKLHQRAKSLRSLELTDGNTITYAGTNNFEMTAGVIYGGINRIIQALYKSADTTFTPVYRDSGVGWDEDDTPRNTIDYANYDDGSGSLANIGNGRYGCHWVYRHVNDGHVYVVYGRGSYKLAEAESAPEPTKPTHLTDFGCLIGCIIVPYGGGSFTSIQMVTDRFFTGTSVADHSELGNLDYASANHTGFEPAKGDDDNFVTDDEKTVIGNTSGINSGDDATPAETTTTIGSLINGADAKTTPVDADMVGLMDSAAANILKKLSWTNIKATLKTYFDTLYSTAVKATGAEIDTGTDDAKFATSKALQDSSIPKGVGAENPTNLLSNGDFESWSAGTSVAPDGWTLASAVVARESSTIKLGTYSSKGTYSAGAFQLNQDIHAAKGISYWKGRTVTLGCWVWCDTASRAILQIQDDTSTGGTNSSYHTGGSTWEWITVTKTITDSVDTDVVRVMLYVITGAASAYFDGAMLVEGSSAFAFADKPMPEVNPTARGILTLEQGHLKFPATANSSSDANTLDDYEEGTWTPIFNSLTVVGTPTYTGEYTKVGRLVTIRLHVHSTITTAASYSATTFTLPFTENGNDGIGLSSTALVGGTLGTVQFTTIYGYGAWSAVADVWITGSYFV